MPTVLCPCFLCCQTDPLKISAILEVERQVKLGHLRRNNEMNQLMFLLDRQQKQALEILTKYNSWTSSAGSTDGKKLDSCKQCLILASKISGGKKQTDGNRAHLASMKNVTNRQFRTVECSQIDEQINRFHQSQT